MIEVEISSSIIRLILLTLDSNGRTKTTKTMLTSKDSKAGLKSSTTVMLKEITASVVWSSFQVPLSCQRDFWDLHTSCSLDSCSWESPLLLIFSWKPLKLSHLKLKLEKFLTLNPIKWFNKKSKFGMLRLLILLSWPLDHLLLKFFFQLLRL